MKLFHGAREAGAGAAETAQLAIETGARLMRLVKSALRDMPPSTLSLSGLRTLAYLADNPGICLSDVAEHLFVGVPTASKQVDDLVERGLLARGADAADRRKLVLTVTPAGEELVATVVLPAQSHIADLLARLSNKERDQVRVGLTLLRALLEPTEREVAGA